MSISTRFVFHSTSFAPRGGGVPFLGPVGQAAEPINVPSSVDDLKIQL